MLVKSYNTHLFVSPCEVGHIIVVAFLISYVFFRASFGNGDVLEEIYIYDILLKKRLYLKILFTIPLILSFHYSLYLITAPLPVFLALTSQATQFLVWQTSDSFFWQTSW